MSSAQEKNATTLANWREVLQNPQEVDEELGSYLKSKGLNTGKKPVKLARLKAIFSTLTKHLDIEYPVGVKDKLIDSLTVAEIDNHLAHIFQSLGASTSWFVDVKRAPEHLVTRYFQAVALRGCHPILKRLKADISTPNFDKIWTCVQHDDEGQAAPPPVSSGLLEPLMRKTHAYTNGEPVASVTFKINDSLKRVSVPDSCESRSEFIELFVQYHSADGRKFETFEQAVECYFTTQTFGARPIVNSFLSTSATPTVATAPSSVTNCWGKQAKVARPMLGPQNKPKPSATKKTNKTAFAELSDGSIDEDIITDETSMSMRNPVFKKRRLDHKNEGLALALSGSISAANALPAAGSEARPKARGLKSLSTTSRVQSANSKPVIKFGGQSDSTTDTDNDLEGNFIFGRKSFDATSSDDGTLLFQEKVTDSNDLSDSHGLFSEFQDLASSEDMPTYLSPTGNGALQSTTPCGFSDAQRTDPAQPSGLFPGPAPDTRPSQPAQCKAGTQSDHGLSHFTDQDIEQGVLDSRANCSLHRADQDAEAKEDEDETTPVAFLGHQVQGFQFTPSQITTFLRNNPDLNVADAQVRRFVLRAVAEAGDVKVPPTPSRSTFRKSNTHSWTKAPSAWDAHVNTAKANGLDAAKCMRKSALWQGVVEKSRAVLRKLNKRQDDAQPIVDKDFNELSTSLQYRLLPPHLRQKKSFHKWVAEQKTGRWLRGNNKHGADYTSEYRIYSNKWHVARSRAETKVVDKVRSAYKQRQLVIHQHSTHILQAQQHATKYDRLGTAIAFREPVTPRRALPQVQRREMEANRQSQIRDAEESRAAGLRRQLQRINSRVEASRVNDTRRATRRTLPAEVLERPTVNMWMDSAVDNEDAYLEHIKGLERRHDLALESLKSRQREENRRWAKCLADPSGHNPCSPARAFCSGQHGGMIACGHERCECGQDEQIMIMDRSMRSHQQEMDRRDIIQLLTEARHELSIIQRRTDAAEKKCMMTKNSGKGTYARPKTTPEQQMQLTRDVNATQAVQLADVAARRGQTKEKAQYVAQLAARNTCSAQVRSTQCTAQLSSPPKLRSAETLRSNSGAFTFIPHTPRKSMSNIGTGFVKASQLPSFLTPTKSVKSTPAIVRREQNIEHPSHPSRQNTGVAIHNSGATWSAAKGQERERVFGHGTERYTALEFEHGDKARLSILHGTMFLFQDKHTAKFKAGTIVSSTHDGENIQLPDGTPSVHRGAATVEWRAQGKSTTHTAPLHNILVCLAKLEDCPLDMQQRIRCDAELADQVMRVKAQSLAEQQQIALEGQQVELARYKALAEAAEKTEHRKTKVTLEQSEAIVEEFINLCDSASDVSASDDGEAKAQWSQRWNKCKEAISAKVLKENLVHAKRAIKDRDANALKGKASKPSAGGAADSKDSASPNSSSSSDSSDDSESGQAPRDDKGQIRFGTDHPVSLNDLMQATNIRFADQWVNRTICLDTDKAAFGIITACNSRRCPPSYKYRTLGGTKDHSISASAAYKGQIAYNRLPEAVRPGSKASEAAEAASEMHACPKALLRKFGPTHQAAILAAEKACRNGNILSLESFIDGGKAVAYLHIVKLLSENEARSLDSITALIITVNALLEPKNIMLSAKEVLNWIFFQWDVHPLASLCARPHGNPRTPNETETIGINSYNKKGNLSIETIKDALETLAMILQAVYGFEFAQRTRANIIMTLDEAKQLVPGSEVAAVNCAMSWGMRQADVKVTNCVKNYEGVAVNGKVALDLNHPIRTFSIFENWSEVKMLRLLPLAGGMIGSASSKPVRTDAATPGAKTDRLWNNQPLNEYKPSPKLVQHAKEWCRTVHATYVDWKTTINTWDKIDGNKYGKHKHQRKCFLRYGFTTGRCLGVGKCSRCFVETQWNKGIKTPPPSHG
jgi:hypothetical protein